ncbi:MAG: carbon monoxide dehydrogenase, partial [Clostridia bacterium]|nr:carbon monoxide dehydrogenase [Clostridia bacterium]
DELKDIKGKRKFARVCVVQTEENSDEQKNYNLIRKIDYIKYHFFPKGFMIRTSSRAHKEGVRVSKAAVKNGISFRLIGSLLIKKYKENPAVKGVTVYYITDEKADFGKLEAMAEKSNKITETLNHVMNSVRFDCDTCNLKPICDEVEGMKELHFRNKE